MWLIKTLAGRIVSGIFTTLLVTGGIAVYTMDPNTKAQMMGSVNYGFGVIGKALGWLLLVGVVPWATYFLSTWVAKFDRNAAGAALVVFYTASEAVMLAWLFEWSISGAAAWIFYVAAVLIALLYNLLICDKIAEMFGGKTA